MSKLGLGEVALIPKKINSHLSVLIPKKMNSHLSKSVFTDNNVNFTQLKTQCLMSFFAITNLCRVYTHWYCNIQLYCMINTANVSEDDHVMKIMVPVTARFYSK